MVKIHVKHNQSIDVESAIPFTLYFDIKYLLIGKINKLAAKVVIVNKLILLVAFCKIVAVENKIKNNDVKPNSKNNTL